MQEFLWVAGTLFAANFGFIFLKAWQQRNVAFDHYEWIIPTSLAMALFEVWVIAKVAQQGFSLGIVVAVGLGAGTGALAAAILHKRFLSRKG